MIVVNNIQKKYQKCVLNNISYKFEEGKIYVIKGISGSGKSSFLNIVGCLDTVYSGDYLVNNVDVKSLDESEFQKYRSQIGYIFQQSLLLSNITIRDNLAFMNGSSSSIEFYAEKLGILDLLEKTPDMLSGGERQRVSIIRSLLNNPTLIIADEPTASLDNHNSQKIASVFREISTENNIIIIATHETCFDEIADEIIYLDYGTITSICKEKCISENSISHKVVPELCVENIKFSVMQYVTKRNNKKYSFIKLLPLVFVIFFLLIALAIQNNFQDEYVRMLQTKYPLNVFSLSTFQHERVSSSLDLILYDNYQIAGDGFVGVPLFEKEYSGLNYGEVIELGAFPQDANQVIVNKEFINEILEIEDYASCIGKKIDINQNTYYISGILSDLTDQEQFDLVYYNVYYDVPVAAKVFIPYETIKQKGVLVTESISVMVRCENLYDRKTTYESLREELHSPISIWDTKVREIQGIIDRVYYVVLSILVIISIIGLLFINNEIRLDLFYRKKELGYLQVFNVPKVTIKRILVLERSFRIIFALGYSVGIYIVLAFIISLVLKINVLMPIHILVIFIIVVTLYSIISVYFPCRKYLKQDIISLIR